MKNITYLFMLLLVACTVKKKSIVNEQTLKGQNDKGVKIAFGSCNKTNLRNALWDDIIDYGPILWIWGGDNIYADTQDMVKLRDMYLAQNEIEDYDKLKKKARITGVWDDHDYGVNDGGEEYTAKKESQQLFLDFMGVSKTDTRRNREGTYSSEILSTSKGIVHIYNLDTRYFRSTLKKSNNKNKRYEPDTTSTKTMLGATQWKWLENELSNSEADFNIVVSSIQFLSGEHGFEKWANFPKEVEKMKQLLIKSGAKGVIFLSGDRHISEFSRMDLEGLDYPLIDFTSSGLTHAYSNFKGEPNIHRIGDVVSTTSYGVVELDFEQGTASFKIMGDGNMVLQELNQTY